jgi:hypothetical protein
LYLLKSGEPEAEVAAGGLALAPQFEVEELEVVAELLIIACTRLLILLQP